MRLILHLFTLCVIFALATSQEALIKQLAAIAKHRSPTLEDIKAILPENTVIRNLRSVNTGKDLQNLDSDETLCDVRVVVL